MTVQQPTSAEYEPLFTDPSVKSMHELSPDRFRRFVAYVFERAGYQAELTAWGSSSVDLKLFVPGEKRPIASVDVRRLAKSSLIGRPAVRRAKRALFFTKRLSYFVTTSDFAQPAYELAKDEHRIMLVNGDRFTRYIHYVLGSRYNATAFGPIPIDVVFQSDKLNLQPTTRTKVLAIANNKGGVGKTTTALYLASGLARAGKRVLLIDVDAQANLTTMILREPPSDMNGKHLGAYFAQRSPLEGFLRRTGSTNVDILPAHPDLRLTDLGGAAHPGMELQFASDVHSDSLVLPIGAHLPYDWIIIDTPPALTMHTRAALAASHFVLAPAVPDVLGLTGLRNLLATLRAVQGLRGNTVRLMGCLVTRWDGRATAQQEYYEDQFQLLAEQFQSHVLVLLC